MPVTFFEEPVRRFVLPGESKQISICGGFVKLPEPLEEDALSKGLGNLSGDMISEIAAACVLISGAINMLGEGTSDNLRTFG